MSRLLWLLPLLVGCPSEYQQGVVPGGGDVPGDTDTDGDDPGNPDIPDEVPTGGLRGVVCEDEFSYLEGAKVSVEHEFGVSVDYTDANGEFFIAELPAGTHVVVIEKGDFHEQITVVITANEVMELASDECVQDECTPEVPCIGLAEAVDRHAVIMTTESEGLLFENVSSQYAICMDEWYVLIGEGTQDAAAGELDTTRLEPGDEFSYPYGADVYSDFAFSNDAWWCVEETQVTVVGGAYTYNGSLVPEPLFDYIHDRSDVDDDGVEDHEDMEELSYVTQYRIWERLNDHPTILVGRDKNLVEIVGEDSATVIIEVTNIGKAEGEASVYETVPAGFIGEEFSPAPVSSQENGDGSITYRWEVALEAAIPGSTADQTWYDQAFIAYAIRAGEDACEGRCVAERLQSDWLDDDGAPWTSESEPLIIEHCSEAE